MTTPAPLVRRRKARRLTQLDLGEVSCVDVPANTGARHVMFKNLASIQRRSSEMTKGDAEETQAAMLARIAGLQRQLADKDQELAFMADRIAVLSTMAAGPIEAAAKAALAPPLDVHKRREAELSGLAIVAKEGRNPGTRATWHSALVDLGQHIAPDLPPTVQLAKAIQDDRGKIFLAAKMAAPQ